MMDPLRTNARIAKIEGSGGPGYFRENNSADKQYFFYRLNADDEVQLISKIYGSARRRNSAQKQVEEGKYGPETFEHEGLFGYVINGHDGEPIAMSPLFPDAESRDQAMQKRTRASASSGPVNLPSGPARHSFRLDFYRGGNEGNWQGRISYPLNDEKQTFQGIDLVAIEAFIQKQFHKTSSDRNKIQFAEEDTPLTIVHEGQTLDSAALPAGVAIDVELALEKLSQSKVYEAQVIAKSLESGEQTLVGRLQGKLASENPLRMKILTDGLPTGLYRLEAEVGIHGAPLSQPLLKRSSLLQLL